jgi:hypothetical protein
LKDFKVTGKVPMQKIDQLANRNFSFILTFCLLVIGFFIPIYRGHSIHPVIIILAMIILILGLMYPGLLTKPRCYWIWLGEKLGFINSSIILTILYLSLFSLIHLFFYLLKRDKMLRKWKQYDSTFKEKNNLLSFSDPF